jgi:hypothetical protein
MYFNPEKTKRETLKLEENELLLTLDFQDLPIGAVVKKCHVADAKVIRTKFTKFTFCRTKLSFGRNSTTLKLEVL